MRYEGALWRPPSEANSLIVQITVGCSHNKCTFCYMYKEKRFRIRNLTEIIEDFNTARKNYSRVDKIFLADGDALIVKTDVLVKILKYIKELFPECKSIAAYATAKSILIKTDEELKLLKANGLKIVYLGIESGSDRVLESVQKGASSKDFIEAAGKIKAAGIYLSVTVLSGLGGKELWEEHAIETGRVLSRINPKYIGILTLIVGKGTNMEQMVNDNLFTPLSPKEILIETKTMLENIDSDGSVLRCNHSSNFINLRGTLNKDKEVLLNQLNDTIRFRKVYPKQNNYL